MGNLLTTDRDDASIYDSSSDEIDDCPDDLAIEIIVEPEIKVIRPEFIKYPSHVEGTDTLANNSNLQSMNDLPPLEDINDNSMEREAIIGMTNLIESGLITKDHYIKSLINYVNLFDAQSPDTILTLIKVIEMSVTKFPYDKDLEYAILPFVNEIMVRSYNLSNDYIDAVIELYTTCMTNQYFRCGRRMIKHIVKREVLADRDPSDTFVPKFTGQVLLIASTYPEYPRPLIETLVMKYSASVEWETTTELHHFATLFNLIYLSSQAKLYELSNTLFDTIIYDITQFRQPKEALECWLTVFVSAFTLDSEVPHYLLCRVVNEINGFIANTSNMCESSAAVVDTMVSMLMLGNEHCKGYANTILASFHHAASAKCSNSVAISLLRYAKKIYCECTVKGRIYARLEPYILLGLRRCDYDSTKELSEILNHLMYHDELLDNEQSTILDTLKKELLTSDDSQSITNSEIVFYKLLNDYNNYFALNWTYISIGLFPTHEAPDNLSLIQKRGIIKLFVSVLGNQTFKQYNDMKTTIDTNWNLIVSNNENYMIHCISKQDHTTKFIEASAPYVKRCLNQ